MCRWITWAAAQAAWKSTRFPACKFSKVVSEMLTTKTTKNRKEAFIFGFLRDLRVLRGLVTAPVVVGYIATLQAAGRPPPPRAAAAAPPRPAAERTADARALRSHRRGRDDVTAAAADGTTALHWASYRD